MNRKIKVFLLAVIAVVFVMTDRTVMAENKYPYLLKVNRKQCVVTAYEMDDKGKYTVPVRAMLCSPGYDTPIGTFKTPEKYRWRLLMGDVWGQYSTRINKGILFHSVWYYEKDPSTLSNRQFNNLGKVVSHGCVRLNVEDAKWIYDNCPVGTTVTIYDSSDPGPLGKPEPIKVSTKTLMGYDPTDIWSEGNPYIKKMPSITGVKDQKVSLTKIPDILSGVKAFSSTGADITKDIKTTIRYQGKTVKKIDVNKNGDYRITYSVADNLGKRAEKEAVFTVLDTTKPKIVGAKNLYLKEGTKVTEALVKEGVTATWHKEPLLDSAITATIKKDIDTESLTTYLVEYKAKAPNGAVAVKKKVVYIDTEAPELLGVSDRNIAMDDVVDEAFARKGVDVKDNTGLVKAKDIKVSVAKTDDTHYKVIYSVADKNKNTTEKEVIFTITNFIRFEGVSNRSIKKNTQIRYTQMLEGVKAYDKDMDITDSIQVGITELDDGKYLVTYTAADKTGQTKSVEAMFTEE